MLCYRVLGSLKPHNQYVTTTYIQTGDGATGEHGEHGEHSEPGEPVCEVLTY